MRILFPVRYRLAQRPPPGPWAEPPVVVRRPGGYEVLALARSLREADAWAAQHGAERVQRKNLAPAPLRRYGDRLYSPSTSSPHRSVMRLHLRLSPNTAPAPFDHLHKLAGVIHKWLGPNSMHDGVSLYSFGWLADGKPHRGGLSFPGGAGWNVSFLSAEAADSLRAGIRRNPSVLAGMRVYEVREQITPAFGTRAHFHVDGAVLTRTNRDDGGRTHLTYLDTEADITLTRTLARRLREAGAGDTAADVAVRFDRTFERARTKLVTIKGTQYRASECPVVVEGTPEAVQAAWLCGVGELTGMGLGALK